MKSAKLKERELIIKLSNNGKTCRETASLLGKSKPKASHWILRHDKTNDLNDKPRSERPTPITREKLLEISLNQGNTAKKLQVKPDANIKILFD